ncbi:MAG: (deoxy)nucleoside triphosphate pyrophosphohydrolase [Bacteroidaceae bacterium]|nr:(deoxy)nucleoside triphosphate pyrophosphohydrolase [Bacteroidaceae bacterium]
MERKKHYSVVAAVIRFGDNVLCMQRGLTRFAYTSYKWEFPGGKVEEGETPQEALRREIKEEMNMEVQIGDFVGAFRNDYPDFSITLQVFWCDVCSPQFDMKEHHDFRWLPLHALPSLDWAEADQKVVEKLLEETKI